MVFGRPVDLHCPKMGLGSFRKFRRAGIPCPAIAEIYNRYPVAIIPFDAEIHNRYPVIIVPKGITK
jgi:hypothetical protein